MSHLKRRHWLALATNAPGGGAPFRYRITAKEIGA